MVEDEGEPRTARSENTVTMATAKPLPTEKENRMGWVLAKKPFL